MSWNAFNCPIGLKNSPETTDESTDESSQRRRSRLRAPFTLPYARFSRHLSSPFLPKAADHKGTPLHSPQERGVHQGQVDYPVFPIPYSLFPIHY
ncbi:MAG: hypothetical protein HLUCCO16_21100 [Phormidium sp. OSCR]|nr:MAG: hypothetical protein HLUCCO16_21100 [Phormidium sp. OSCR]